MLRSKKFNRTFKNPTSAKYQLFFLWRICCLNTASSFLTWLIQNPTMISTLSNIVTSEGITLDRTRKNFDKTSHNSTELHCKFNEQFSLLAKQLEAKHTPIMHDYFLSVLYQLHTCYNSKRATHDFTKNAYRYIYNTPWELLIIQGLIPSINYINDTQATERALNAYCQQAAGALLILFLIEAPQAGFPDDLNELMGFFNDLAKDINQHIRQLHDHIQSMELIIHDYVADFILAYWHEFALGNNNEHLPIVYADLLNENNLLGKAVAHIPKGFFELFGIITKNLNLAINELSNRDQQYKTWQKGCALIAEIFFVDSLVNGEITQEHIVTLQSVLLSSYARLIYEFHYFLESLNVVKTLSTKDGLFIYNRIVERSKINYAARARYNLGYTLALSMLGQVFENVLGQRFVGYLCYMLACVNGFKMLSAIYRFTYYREKPSGWSIVQLYDFINDSSSRDLDWIEIIEHDFLRIHKSPRKALLPAVRSAIEQQKSDDKAKKAQAKADRIQSGRRITDTIDGSSSNKPMLCVPSYGNHGLQNKLRQRIENINLEGTLTHHSDNKPYCVTKYTWRSAEGEEYSNEPTENQQKAYFIYGSSNHSRYFATINNMPTLLANGDPFAEYIAGGNPRFVRSETNDSGIKSFRNMHELKLLKKEVGDNRIVCKVVLKDNKAGESGNLMIFSEEHHSHRKVSRMTR